MIYNTKRRVQVIRQWQPFYEESQAFDFFQYSDCPPHNSGLWLLSEIRPRSDYLLGLDMQLSRHAAIECLKLRSWY